MNNKNTLIGFILIAAILFGWMYFMTPSKEELAKQQHIQDSLRRARMEQRALDSLRMAEQQQSAALAQLADSTAMAEMDSATLAQHKANALTDQFGIFAASAQGEERTWTVESQLHKLTFSSKGGFLKQVELKNYKNQEK